jgi:hypothetical protein
MALGRFAARGQEGVLLVSRDLPTPVQEYVQNLSPGSGGGAKAKECIEGSWAFWEACQIRNEMPPCPFEGCEIEFAQ